MDHQILHIFRNNPFGREVFLQSLYFAKKVKITPNVYIPQFRQFLMYLRKTVVTVDLDKTFLHSPDTAREHAEAMIRNFGLKAEFLTPTEFTSGRIPNLPVDVSYMCCPRSISDLSTKIGLGYIGPKVRGIIKNSTFPILIPSPVFKRWKNITVFFGGSDTAVKAMRLAIHISEMSGLPLYVFTQAEKKSQKYYREIMVKNGIFQPIENQKANWMFFDKGKFRDNLYEVSHKSLVVVGTVGHSLVKEVLFGSKAEKLQTILPNNFLLVGPHYTPYF